MKKLIFKRLLTMALAVAMLIQMIPVTALATEEDDYVYLEVTTGKTLRGEPYQDSEVFCDVQTGDILLAVDSVVNKYDNLWYKVLCAEGEYAYIYSEGVTLHTHQMSKIDDNLSICRCGYYEANGSGENRQINAVADAGQLLNPDIVEAAQKISAALTTVGVTLGKALSCVTPYFIAVVVIGGTIYHIAINVDSTNAEVEAVHKDFRDFDSQSGKNGRYYCAMRSNGTILVAYNHPMDIDQACDYLYAATLVAPALQTGKGLDFRNIYTPLKNDAQTLVKKFTSIHGDFAYGNDWEPNEESDHDKDKSYFEHYHLYNIFDRFVPKIGTSMKHWKKKNFHVFFGSPLTSQSEFPAA